MGLWYIFLNEVEGGEEEQKMMDTIRAKQLDSPNFATSATSDVSVQPFCQHRKEKENSRMKKASIHPNEEIYELSEKEPSLSAPRLLRTCPQTGAEQTYSMLFVSVGTKHTDWGPSRA